MKEETKSIKINQTKFNKRREGTKWFGFGLLLIIGYGLLRGFFMVFVINNFSRTLNLITRIFSLLLPLFIEILIVYFFVLRERRKNGGNERLHKKLKITLIVFLPFLLLAAFSFFTLYGVIPNRFSDARNICPKGYTYGTYSNTIKGYANIGYPPNRNRKDYEQNFKNWENDLRNKEIQEFTFGPFEGCIPEDGKLENGTDSDRYDYVFCTINMIPLNNECPEGYRFLRAGVAGPYDLCQGKSDFVIDRKGYIHIHQIPL